LYNLTLIDPRSVMINTLISPVPPSKKGMKEDDRVKNTAIIEMARMFFLQFIIFVLNLLVVKIIKSFKIKPI
jgi:hypothetical protein